MSTARILRWAAALASLLLLISGNGCSRGPDGPQRNPLGGKITLKGRPVEGGRIVFAPDGSKGNAGPGTIAFIKQGKFQTPPGHGVVAGPHVVDILGYDEEVDLQTDAEPASTVKRKMNIEVPPQGGTYDFEL